MAGWMRLYTEIRHDRKIRRLPPSLRWLWVVIMTMAKDSPEPGWLKLSCNVTVTVDDLVDEADIPLQEVNDGIKVFTEQEMLEKIDGVYHLVNWDKRQYVSDSSAERVRKHRDKAKKEPVSSIKDVTLQERYSNDNVTPPETEYRDRVQSTETDKKESKRAREKKPSPEPETAYAENVTMTEQQYQALVSEHGEDFIAQCIETLSNYKASSGKTYKSDYHAIKNWVITRVKEDIQRLAKQATGPPGSIPRAYSSVDDWERQKEDEISDA